MGGQVPAKGVNGKVNNAIQGAGLFEQVRSTWYHSDLDRPVQSRSGRLVQIQHFEVPTADDQQSRRLDPPQRVPGKIWSASPRDHQLNMIRYLRCGNKRRRGARAGAEQCHRYPGGVGTIAQPPNRARQPGGQTRDIEPELSGSAVDLVFFRSQQIHQQSSIACLVQLRRDHPITRTVAAAAAAVGKDDDSRRVRRQDQVTVQDHSGSRNLNPAHKITTHQSSVSPLVWKHSLASAVEYAYVAPAGVRDATVRGYDVAW